MKTRLHSVSLFAEMAKSLNWRHVMTAILKTWMDAVPRVQLKKTGAVQETLQLYVLKFALSLRD